MACQVIWEEKGILFRHSGSVDINEIMEANDHMYGNVRYENIKYQISDYSAVTNNLITGKEAEIVGTLDRSSSVWNRKMLVAVVTKDIRFIPIVERYFSKLADLDWTCRIFGDLEEAYHWIREQLQLK